MEVKVRDAENGGFRGVTRVLYERGVGVFDSYCTIIIYELQ